MRRIIYFTMISLDGYMEKPGGSLDWISVDEELLPLHKQPETPDRRLSVWAGDVREQSGFVIDRRHAADGRTMRSSWRRTGSRLPRSFSPAPWHGSKATPRWSEATLSTVVARLKEQSGPDLEVGGAQLVPTLIQAGLVDEYRLFVQPILMGDGRPIFPVLNEAVRLKLVETHAFHSGVVYLRYQR